MTIDPTTLPDGTVAHISDGGGVVDISLVSLWDGGTRYSYRAEGRGGWSVQGHTITRVFVPVPEGMTYADAVAALADAGAWVEVEGFAGIPEGPRLRMEWGGLSLSTRTYVHRDDLPPADPDAELVKSIAADLDKAWKACKSWDYEVQPAPVFSDLARAALTVVREHEARS